MKTAVVAGLLMLATLSGAGAEELTILSAAAVRPALIEVPPLFEKETGHRVKVSFGNATAIQDKVAAGDAVDLVILPPLQLDDLIERRFLTEESRTALGVVRLGIAAHAGRPVPVVRTVEDFRRALLVTPSFGMPDPADGSTSSTYLARLLQELGIADEMRVKTILFPDGTKALQALAIDEIALTVAPITSIRAVPGVVLAASLPEAIQLKTVYVAALTRKSASSPAAAALLQMLTSADITALLQQKGIDPP
jgi:molybdate transport system substrate-binding protein